MSRTVFYHVAAMGHWMSVLGEQLRHLEGFTDHLLVGYAGDPYWEDFVVRAAAQRGITAEIVVRRPDASDFEFPILREMQRAVRGGLEGNIYYLHTKGVSAPECLVRTLWRWIMNAAMLADGGARIENALESADWAGPVICEDLRYVHSAGNYFGARASHIRKLPDIDDYRACFMDRYRGILPFDFGERHAAEMWIGCCQSVAATTIPELVVPSWGVSCWEWWLNRKDVQDYAVRHGS